MKKTTNILVCILVVISVSCTTHKKLTYMNDLDPETPQETFITPSTDYRIQKKDILYINIMTLDPEINEVYNPLMSGNNNVYLQYEATQYLYGQSINDSGCVTLPVIGNVQVVDKTLSEAQVAIEEEARKFIKEPVASVKLLSYSFSVLGEVKAPGRYPSYNPQLTVFEAISRAGDMNDYGNRKRVHIIRTLADTTQVADIDLTSKNIISSEYFYVLPNDVIYVEPLKFKSFRMNIPTISVALGAISTFVLVLNYVDKQ
ncbi:MAG: polysaccharide export protein [Bacteroidales bacterium]|nr:polysaccharide export protein [Bacteroidales bacterium]